MGVLDVFTFVNQGWLSLEEQRNIFDVTFTKPKSLGNLNKEEFTFSTVTQFKPGTAVTNTSVAMNNNMMHGDIQQQHMMPHVMS